MAVSVITNNTIVVQSGVLNSPIVNNMSIISFIYDGLPINLVTTLSYGQPQLPQQNTFFANVENGIVSLNQVCIVNANLIDVKKGSTGMLIPFEVGTKPNGKKISMSWSSSVLTTNGGVYVLSTSYTIYEEL